MKPYLTVKRLKNYVEQFLKFNACDANEVSELYKIVDRITCTMQAPVFDDNGNIVYEEEPGWCHTYEDWIAYTFNKWGCEVTCTQDWYDGSPTYTISMPKTIDEEKENKRICKETWAF